MARILVADDEVVVRDLLRYGLEREGHEVLEAGTGPQALDTLKKNPVDLLVLDVMLPGMDGYTLQLEMAQDEKTKGVPVIILTALHPTKTLFSKFAQVKAFVAKPFDPTEMSRLVGQVLADMKPS